MSGNTHNPEEKTPWWMTAIIVACMIPALIIPFAITKLPDENPGKLLFWFYPAYVICAGLCSWMTYPKRPETAWILLVLMLLSHAGMYMLIEGI